ncbi:MAG: aldo/keto reductase [Sphaerochaetaceae bacterium]|nr:aldo/keto reductase [Sphaerochaetaceae bacterium]
MDNYGIKGKFGFGCMRLPRKGKTVLNDLFIKMTDTFIENGFNYFDTAHGYMNEKSEIAVRECLTSRYPRDSYMLTDKLSENYFEKQEDIRPLFFSQLEACGVSWFDFYLMHAQDRNNYPKYQRTHAYEEALKLKEEGYIKHLGLSFHDSADVLEKILKDHSEIEVVQIQLNYFDWDSVSVESKKVYEVCEKYGKAVFIMEPLKGGSLVKLPEEGNALLDKLREETGESYSNAGYGLRFAADNKNVIAVLSGMGNMEMMEDNLKTMKNLKPLTEKERKVLFEVAKTLRGKDMIACTSCHYCTSGCPKSIPIPDIFSCRNNNTLFNDWNSVSYYQLIKKEGRGADSCIKCGKCESVCPQHLEIRELLKECDLKLKSNY